jgi:hypothetical protein
VIENVSYDNEKSVIVVAGPDVAVTSITAPDYAAVGRSTVVSGTVANPGTSNEWVTVSFKVDSVVQGTQDVYLTSGSNTNVEFDWVPSMVGTYPVGIAASITGQEPYLGNNEMSKNVSVFIANGVVLLIDDDAGDTYETYFENALMPNAYLYTVWDHSSQGSPSPNTMAMYDSVIWFTGDDYSDVLSTQDQTNLQTYLTNGGRLFITGQDIGYAIGSTTLYHNYLHATYQVDDAGPRTVTGTVDDPIGNGLTLAISGGDGANNQNWPDGIQATSPGTVPFSYQGSSYKAAVKTDTAGYKVVYFAFGFEAISTQTDRNEVMHRVLEWLIGNMVDPSQSSVTLSPGTLVTCPAGDGPVYTYLTVTVKNAGGAPLPGIPSAAFTFTVNPTSLGTHWYGALSVTFTAVDPVTDANGQIRFSIRGGTSIYGNITIRVTVQSIPLNDVDTLPSKTPDYDTNGQVALGDFVIFGQDYGRVRWRSDFTDDGLVSLGDFVIFGQHYGHHA